MIELAKHIPSIGGAGGLTNIPSFLINDYGRLSYVVLVLTLAALTVQFVRWLARGPYGRMMAAMRDDELAFTMLGRNAIWVKVSAFAIGSGIAGLAGALYAHYFRFLEPDQFGREVGEPLQLPLGPALLQDDGLALHIAERVQPLQECITITRASRQRVPREHPYPGEVW